MERPPLPPSPAGRQNRRTHRPCPCISYFRTLIFLRASEWSTSWSKPLPVNLLFGAFVEFAWYRMPRCLTLSQHHSQGQRRLPRARCADGRRAAAAAAGGRSASTDAALRAVVDQAGNGHVRDCPAAGGLLPPAYWREWPGAGYVADIFICMCILTGAGLAFPTGLSLNHCAAHWTPNKGDTTVLKAWPYLLDDYRVAVPSSIDLFHYFSLRFVALAFLNSSILTL